MYLGHVELLGPVVGPVKFPGWWSHLFHLATHKDTVDERAKEHHEAEDEHTQTNVPDKGRVVQLEDDNEAQCDEEECQVKEDHEAADTLGVGATRVGSCHRLHHQLASPGRLGLDAHDVTGSARRPVRVLTDLRLWSG